MENLPAGGGHSGNTVFGDTLLDCLHGAGGRGTRCGETTVLGMCHRVCRQYPDAFSGASCETKV